MSKYLILLLLLSSCNEKKGIPIDLHYKENVTVTIDFYGESCCKTIEKHSNTTYLFFCQEYAAQIVENGVNGIITKSCKK